jgi:hypothetical protein
MRRKEITSAVVQERRRNDTLEQRNETRGDGVASRSYNGASGSTSGTRRNTALYVVRVTQTMCQLPIVGRCGDRWARVSRQCSDQAL